jgi:hypothetical protein
MMMQKFTGNAFKAITGAVLVLAFAHAQAADWRRIGGTDAGDLSIDAASIKQKGDVREAWSMWNFKQPRANNEASFPALKSYQDLHLYNCKDKTMRLTREVIYADNNGTGDKRDHSEALKGMTFAKPAPDSVAELMLMQVCSADAAK